jgi:hypothetical protein
MYCRTTLLSPLKMTITVDVIYLESAPISEFAPFTFATQFI